MSVNFHDIVTEKISDNISERENDKIYKMKCGMLSGPDSNEDLSIARSLRQIPGVDLLSIL